MNTALAILIAVTAASVLSLLLGLIGTRYTSKVKVIHVEGIPLGVTVHKGYYVAAVTGFFAVVAALVPTDLSLLQSLIPAIIAGAIGYFGTKALIDLIRGRS
jgi:hypothetical protein